MFMSRIMPENDLAEVELIKMVMYKGFDGFNLSTDVGVRSHPAHEGRGRTSSERDLGCVL